jgi:beta-lactamase regulating signal transducer with metallopeptidase domain
MDISWLLPLAGMVARGSNAVGAWLLTYAVHSSVLLLAAWWLVSRRRLRWSPTAQHAIWSVAMVAGFVTAGVQVASPRPSVGGALQLAGMGKGTVAAVQVTRRSTDAPWPTVSAGARSLVEPPFARPVAGPASAPASIQMMVFTISRATIAVGLWGVVALALLAHLAVARRRLRLTLDSRRAATDSLAAGALRHLVSRAGIRRRVYLATSDALQAPAAISSDEIVLPSRALHELTLAQQEGVLAHELAHLVRRDTRWLRVALWIERLAWFQPLNRIARRQMQLSAEFAADAWAVRLTRQPITLAQALARVAGWLTTDSRSTAAFVAGADGSPLVERVRRLTAPVPERDGLGGRVAHGAVLLASLCALALLPRVDVGHRGGGSQRFDLIERVDLRVRQGDSLPNGAVAPFAEPSGMKMGIRLLRLRDSAIRVIPANGESVRDSSAARHGPGRILVIARDIS